MPTVSVIVPNYCHAPYLEQRIESILQQTFQDFELILLDDCSTDGSPGIPIRTGCATEQCKDRLSRRKAATPDIEEAHLAVLRPQLLPKSRRN